MTDNKIRICHLVSRVYFTAFEKLPSFLSAVKKIIRVYKNSGMGKQNIIVKIFLRRLRRESIFKLYILLF